MTNYKKLKDYTYEAYCLGILQYKNKQPEPFWKIIKEEVLR